MSYLYTVMQTDVSEFLGSGASYANDKLLLKGLTSNEANTYSGEVYRVDEIESLSTIELSQIADDLTAEIESEGTLTVFSKAQGRWLYANHDSFKPLTT
tara:strand:+ start:926 stop:1222 length:297 start_codon:yes stop_codon:yes gene_type:complete